MPGLKQLYTLAEAALMISPTGMIAARSLRAEINNGRLSITRVAGKMIASEDQLKEFLGGG